MAVAALLFFSCNKEVENHYTAAKGTTQSSVDTHDFSLHKPRFYDSLGILHNQILANFHKIFGKNNPGTPNHFRQFLSEYMREKKDEKIVAPINLPPEKALDIIKRYLKNDFGTIGNPEVEHCLRDIFNTVKETRNFDTILYKQRLFRLEKQIKLDEKLRPDEKNMLLATAAIARHSGCYWLDFYKNQDENLQNSRIGLFKKLLKAVGVTLADATAIAYDYFSDRPLNEWVENAAWFSELGYWSIDYLLNGYTYN